MKPIHGALPIALATRRAGVPKLVVPEQNAAEAALGGVEQVYGAASLADAVALLRRRDALHRGAEIGDVEAAAQVAHAVTVHKVAVEDDFFTAVDDLSLTVPQGAATKSLVAR